MKIDRLALIAAIEQAEQHQADTIAKAKELAARERQQRVDEWVEANRQPWADAIKKIQARLRKGEPVQEGDIPYDRTSRSNGAAVWHERYSRISVPTPDETLTGLRTMLEAVTDEQVSTTSLRDLGVTARTLQKIIPLLGAMAAANRKAAD